VKVRGVWTYLYRAVDRDGQTLDFMLSEQRDTAAAKQFFARAMSTNGIPQRIVIDKSRSNAAGIKAVNLIFKRLGTCVKITTVQSKYLNKSLNRIIARSRNAFARWWGSNHSSRRR